MRITRFGFATGLGVLMIGSCGDGDSTAGTDQDEPLTGRHAFDNWECQTSDNGHCYARCFVNGRKEYEIACDGSKCVEGGVNITGTPECEVTPKGLDECGDCRKAFDSGCDGFPE